MTEPEIVGAAIESKLSLTSDTILPLFQNGVLPPGDYRLTIAQLRSSHLVLPLSNYPKSWDAKWRDELVTRLDTLVHQLWDVGIEDIFVDGSFVEDKDHPNDIDGYFVCDPKTFFEKVRLLNELDPLKIWTWDANRRTLDRDSAKEQLPMWHRYRVELYPHLGQPSGIKDKFGHDQQFPAAFRKSRAADKPKGIVQIIKE